jgi:hypothetical protein
VLSLPPAPAPDISSGIGPEPLEHQSTDHLSISLRSSTKPLAFPQAFNIPVVVIREQDRRSGEGMGVRLEKKGEGKKIGNVIAGPSLGAGL